jgi:hypothetical protein
MTKAVITRLVKLPTSVKGISHENADGTYTVLLNEDLNLEQQREAFEHELSHIDQGENDSIVCADELEKIEKSYDPKNFEIFYRAGEKLSESRLEELKQIASAVFSERNNENGKRNNSHS